jgi:hypothetical protein
MSSLVRGRSGSNQTRLEWMIGRGGTVANSQRWYGELGTVELVAPGSAVVDEGGLPRHGSGYVIDIARHIQSRYGHLGSVRSDPRSTTRCANLALCSGCLRGFRLGLAYWCSVRPRCLSVP